MNLKDFWFSYKNIIIRNFYKKKYLSVLRKIFGFFYKFLTSFIKKNFTNFFINLDIQQNDKQNYQKLNLDSLFVKFNCDKGSYCIWNGKKVLTHKYSIFYEKYLSHLRTKKINLLEIGSHEGRGIASFYYYFSNSKLIGANINPFQMMFKSKRIREIYIDVASEVILENFTKHINHNFDIIIDDASHNLKDILITLSKFFKKLEPGGLYIIEDMDQFNIFNELNSYKDELTPKEILIKIKKKEHFNSAFIFGEEKKYLLDNIKDIRIETGSMVIKGENASTIAFITKK